MSDWNKFEKLGKQEHCMSPEDYKKYENQLITLYDGIVAKLKKYPNFNGVRFHISEKANEVVVDLLHSKAYRDYAVRYFLHTDFIGARNIMDNCENDWLAKDNNEAIKEYYNKETEKLIADCEKYGYD